MREIITAVKRAAATLTEGQAVKTALIDALEGSTYLWQPDYPVALLHAVTRIDNDADAAAFTKARLLDAEGRTPSHPSTEQLDTIAAINPAYLQRVGIMVLTRGAAYLPHFEVKRQNDYWKKIKEAGPIKAMVELSEFGEQVSLCDAESLLRDIIRKRKEVHALKDVGFIWIAVSSDDLSDLFRLYFRDNYTYIETPTQGIHIGWRPTLRSVSMRDFLCPPQ